MLLAVCDDGAGNAGIDARYMLEEGSGSRVDLDTGEVDAGYHNAIKHGSQFFLIYVMLVQPYADGFRVDLHQFGQGILQAPRDRDGPALCSIKIGEFCTRSSTIAYDDDVNVMLREQPVQCLLCFLGLV